MFERHVLKLIENKEVQDKDKYKINKIILNYLRYQTLFPSEKMMIENCEKALVFYLKEVMGKVEVKVESLNQLYQFL